LRRKLRGHLAMDKDFNLFLLIFATLLLGSGGVYLFTISIIEEIFLFWVGGCIGMALGLVGLINVGRILDKEEKESKKK
jgi:hypothetical protein